VRRGVALILLAASACGRNEPSAPAAAGETPEYREWRGRQMPLPVANFAATVKGRVTVLPPESRSRGADDFCEITLNGAPLHRFRVGKMPDGRFPRCEVEATFNAGPNWLDLWDSTSRRGCRRQIDTREGTDFTFVPTADGYDLRQSKTE
jgi:hypothetical protein